MPSSVTPGVSSTKRVHAAAVDRQFLNVAVVHYLRQVRLGVFHQRRRGRHVHAGGRLADGQRDVQIQILADLQDDALGVIRSKSVGGYGYGITWTRGQLGRGENAFRIRSQGA